MPPTSALKDTPRAGRTPYCSNLPIIHISTCEVFAYAMGVKIGPVIRRLRERHRLTQQDLVDYARLDRSSSYISAVEGGRTSPTLAELEAIAQVFRTTAIGLIQEAQEDASDLSVKEKLTAEALFEQLSPESRSLALDFMAMLRERERRQEQTRDGK